MDANPKKQRTNQPQCKPPKCDTAANPTKQRIVGTEPMLPTTHDLSDTTHKKVKGTPPSHNQQTNPMMKQKTSYAAPALWGNSRREGIFSTRTPNNVYNRHDCRVLRHPIRSMAETTSNRIYETIPATRGSKSNTSKRSGLQKRLPTSRKNTLSTNHHHQSTRCSDPRTPS